MTLQMFDSIYVANLPPGADAYAGYVDGHWPTFPMLKAWTGDAHLLSIAVFPSDDAECLDVETGDATPAQAPAWVKRQHARGVRRPVLYANAATMGAVGAALAEAGIPRDSIRLLSAHYGAGRHICGPATCAYPGCPAADGTQWRDNAPGASGSLVDESLLHDDFFTGPRPPGPSPLQEETMPFLLNKGQGARTPVALPDGATSVRLFASQNAKVSVDLRHQGTENPELALGYGAAEPVPIPAGVHAIVIHRLDAGEGDVSAAVS